MLTPFDEVTNPDAVQSYLHTVLESKLRNSYVIAVRDTIADRIHYFDTRFGWDLDRFVKSIEKMASYEILDPPKGLPKYKLLKGSTRLEIMLNWYIKNQKSFVVRDNYGRWLHYQSLDPIDPHYPDDFHRTVVWDAGDLPDTSEGVRDTIKSMGWFDIETVRYGESWNDCQRRLPNRWVR
jgi:hypothetical protein